MIYFNASFGFRQRFSFVKLLQKARNRFFYNLHKSICFLLDISPKFFPIFPSNPSSFPSFTQHRSS